MARAKAIVEFASKCLIGLEKSEFVRALDARQQGRRLGQAKFGALFPLTEAVISIGSEASMLALLHALHDRSGAYLYRREMFFAMRSALQLKATRQLATLAVSAWEVQNRIRHAGRRLGDRSIGSTLLVKGLEFERAIIVAEDSMTRKDWYVALTRATTSIRVISSTERFKPLSH